uniref:Uncharacterized protein n=1 Tax=Zea mays TaxID=4577 RepID=A0A804LEY1_MAIZE
MTRLGNDNSFNLSASNHAYYACGMPGHCHRGLASAKASSSDVVHHQRSNPSAGTGGLRVLRSVDVPLPSSSYLQASATNLVALAPTSTVDPHAGFASMAAP